MKKLLIGLVASLSVLAIALFTWFRTPDIIDTEVIDPFVLEIEQPSDSMLIQHELHNGSMQLEVVNWGARIKSLCYQGTDVVLGFDTLEQYQTVKQNFGAVVGRYIGRIIGGTYVLDGDTAHLQLQASGDCGHGGNPNFGGRLWQYVPGLCNDTTVTLRYISPDGENGFPGQLTILTTYTLTADALRIDYQARTTKPTVLNPSIHSFFNLTGDLSADILAEELWIDSDSIALYNEQKKVTGQLGCITQTPFDFRQPRTIGDSIDAPNFQLSVTGGYDHCYQLKHYLYKSAAAQPAGSVDYDEHKALLATPVAHLHDNQTGLTMQVYTTEPALQIYTANGHKGNILGKGDKVYPRRNAICFETMHFPDSPNQPQWPSAALRPGETFQSTTIYRFHSGFQL